MKRVIIAIVIVSVLIGSLLFIPFFKPIARWIARPLNFIGSNLYYAKNAAGNFSGRFFCPKQSEFDELNNKIKRLSEENVRLSTASQENNTLRAQLEFFKTNPYSRITGNIVGRSSNSYSSSFIIDKGSGDGIRENLAVITDNGIIIGKTTTVRETTSEVLLLNDKDSKLLVMIPNKKDSTGIVQGQFGLGITMDLIPITGEVIKDDIIVTAGLEHGIPPGLIVGSVASVQFQQGDLFKNAQIKGAVSYDNVHIVSVLLPK